MRRPQTPNPRRTPTLLVVALTLAPTALLCPARTSAQATLSVEEALARAAQRSPSLRASVADAHAARESSLSAEAARAPVFTASASGAYQESLLATTLAVLPVGTQSLGASTGVSYTTELGTALSIEVGTEIGWRSTSVTPASSMLVTIGPNYGVDLSISARQPLLRGAGDDATLATIREARATQSQAERTRDEAASTLMRDVLVAYWELWYAERAVQVQEEALRVAEEQARQARIRHEDLGLLAATEALRFHSELASVRQQRSQAEHTRQTRALELARLLALDDGSSLGVTGAPPEVSPPPSVASLRATARASSSELLALQAQVDASEARARGAADADQIRVDLTATVGMAGLWTDTTLANLALPNDRPAFGGQLGLEMELPLGERQAAAEHRRASAQVEAAEARYDAGVDRIESEVAQQHAALLQAIEVIALTAEIADVARALAEAEQRELELGTTTATEVIQAQQAHREAELARLRAVVDQVSASLALDHVTGALLTRYAALAGSGS